MTSAVFVQNEITRTFTPFRESDSKESDLEFWFQNASGDGTTWSQVLEKRIVVIVGEAGLGKTFEFKRQARRLTQANQFAFFVPLNLLSQPEDWRLGLDQQKASFESWKLSERPAYFFLDAVDEARLNGTTALLRSLSCVRHALEEHIHRVHFFVSSRISDWNIAQVREIVTRELRITSNAASPNPVHSASGNTTQDDDGANALAPIVYSLDPLSSASAKALAIQHGIANVDAFWDAVVDGAYEFLAVRPLDLAWMAERWVDKGELGHFKDLVEAAIQNRLEEMNPGYIEAGVVLSRNQLRSGAEAVAAASVFSRRAYLQVEPGVAQAGAIAIVDVLPEWTPLEHQRLLGSAIFDEATYGRVQFHHRAIREYLAACWVKSQLDLGLPIATAWSLFSRSVGSEEVLVPSRRAVLCWLAALDARVRSRVIRFCPEMVSFEGDPQQWSISDVVEAFFGYLKRLKLGFRADWWNDESELRRVAKMLPAQDLMAWIDLYKNDSAVLQKLLLVIKHGQVDACANQVFALYKDPSFLTMLHPLLDTLSVVATPDQRAEMARDLTSGKLIGNQNIAAGIEAVGIGYLSVEQLRQCFAHTESEPGFGGGAMAMAIKAHILPTATFQDATKLLHSLASSLPYRARDEYASLGEDVAGPESWMLNVLPDVLANSLGAELTGLEDLSSILRATTIVDKLRHTGFASEEDFQRIRMALEKHPMLRKRVALQIGTGGDSNAASTLMWLSGVVNLTGEDISWLIDAANNQEGSPRERALWFEISLEFSFKYFRGEKRAKILNQLSVGPDVQSRQADIAVARSQRVSAVQTRRKYRFQALQRKRSAEKLRESNRTNLLLDIDGIRAGKNFESIRWLVQYAASKSRESVYTQVKVEVIYDEFGAEIGKALEDGLTHAWKFIDAPDSTEYVGNSSPWTGLVGLASVNHAFANGLSLDQLSANDVEKVVRLSVWDRNGKSKWLSLLAERRSTEICNTLRPWFDFEMAIGDDVPARRTIELVLNGPPSVCNGLLPFALTHITNQTVVGVRLRSRLLSACIEARLIDAKAVASLARKALEKGVAETPVRFDPVWFGDWVAVDLKGAWAWFNDYRKSSLASNIAFHEQVFTCISESKRMWKVIETDSEIIPTLVEIYRYLNAVIREELRPIVATPR